MLNLGADEIARYPFLADAGQYLKDMGFSLEQFGADPELRPRIDQAYERITVAADGKVYRSDLEEDDGKASKNEVLPRETLSFLLAIVLLKLTGMHTLIKRFALAEAKRAERYLEKDLKKTSVESNQLATRIINDLFSVKVEKVDDYFTIPASDYLKHSVHFHEREWKLVNRRVEKGHVLLTSHETVRLIRKELGSYINSKIINTKTPKMIPGFEDTVAKLVSLSKKFITSPVTTGEYPPCIKHAITILERGENLPHSGRFMLATFLLARGQTISQIAPLFKNAPDYNARVTLYQLNHLAGTRGSGTKYSCPSCEKLKTQSLCFIIPACDGIINPLQFGRKSIQ